MGVRLAIIIVGVGEDSALVDLSANYDSAAIQLSDLGQLTYPL